MSHAPALPAHGAPLRGPGGGSSSRPPPGPPRRPGQPARSSTPRPPSAPAGPPAKPPARRREVTGKSPEFTGKSPAPALAQVRDEGARLFTANKAPSGPQLPRTAPRTRSAGRAIGALHRRFTGGSPGNRRPEPRPPTRRAPPPTCADAGVFHGFQADPRHPRPRSCAAASGTVTGDSPAVHRGLTGSGPRALPNATRARTSAEGALFHGFQAIRDTPPTGKAPARRGALHRRFTGGSSGVHREKPGPYINPPPPRHGPRSTAPDKL